MYTIVYSVTLTIHNVLTKTIATIIHTNLYPCKVIELLPQITYLQILRNLMIHI